MSDNIRIPLEVSLDDLAEQFLSLDRKQVMAFLLKVDEHMSDCDFTEELHAKLADALAAEGASTQPTMKEFLRWLVRMDDPQDEQGCKDRQVVTLTQIISKARNLLGES